MAMPIEAIGVIEGFGVVLQGDSEQEALFFQKLMLQ